MRRGWRIVHAVVVTGVERCKLDLGHDIVDNGTYDGFDDRAYDRRVDGRVDYDGIDRAYHRRHDHWVDDWAHDRRDDDWPHDRRKHYRNDHGCQHDRVDDERDDVGHDRGDDRRMDRQHDRQCRHNGLDHGHGNLGRNYRWDDRIGNHG